jgi:hypothetical protein
VRIGHLAALGQVEPDLEQLQRVGRGRVQQREHLRVHDALAGRHPLHVAAAEARGGAQRVAVVDQALAHDGHGLEAAVRVGREAGHLSPWYMLQPSLRLKSWPMSRPASEAAGPIAPLPRG